MDNPAKGSLAAVIGLGLRLPGASNVQEFSSLFGNPGEVGSHLDQHSSPDYEFFNISPHEIQSHGSAVLGTVLEVVAECIMDSGVTFKDVSGKRTGLYLQSNLKNCYSELTNQVAQNFNLTGPVINFACLDVTPAAAHHTALVDLMASQCDLALVVGVCMQGSSHCEEESISTNTTQQVTEGVVALLISSDLVQSSRIYAEIIKLETIEKAGQNASQSDSSGQPQECTLEATEFFQLESQAASGKKRNISCGDIVLNICRSSYPISAVTAIVACITHMLPKGPEDDGLDHEKDPSEEQTAGKLNFLEDQTVCCVGCTNPDGTMLQVLLRGVKTVQYSNGSASPAVLIPTTVHPLTNVNEAEEALRAYECREGFLQFLTRSELSKGLKGPLQQLHYFLKLPGSSRFSKLDFSSFEEMPFIVVFEDFLMSGWKPSSNILNLPLVYRSMLAIDEILQQADVSYSVMKAIKLGNIPDVFLEGGMMTRIACQLAMVDILTNVNSACEVYGVSATGLGSIAAAYADGAVTQVQAVHIAAAIEKSLNSLASEMEDLCMLDIFCPTDDVFQLGPWVQILYHFSNGMFRIATPLEKKRAIIELIMSKGFAHSELSITVPVYSHAMRKHLSGLEKQLKFIFTTASFWSPKVEILGIMSKDSKNRKCDASFFIDVLSSPYDTQFDNKKLFELSYTAQMGQPNSPLNHIAKENSTTGQASTVNQVIQSDQSLQQLQTTRIHDDDLISIPSVEADSKDIVMNCSTNVLKGSFLCPSIHTESLSSASEETSGKMKESKKILQEHCRDRTTQRQEQNFIYLHFFSPSFDSCLNSFVSEEDSSKAESVSTGDTTTGSSRSAEGEPVHVYIKANQIGYLESLVWIHATGHTMEAEKQFTDSPITTQQYYCGDFVIHSLWTWNREYSNSLMRDPQNIQNIGQENVTMYALSTKPRLEDTVLQTVINKRSMQDLVTVGAENTEGRSKAICAFDACLLMLSGYKWEPSLKSLVSISVPGTCIPVEELKLHKQVRFTRNKTGAVDGQRSPGDEIDPSVQSFLQSNENYLLSSLQYDFTNPGDLLAALNKVQCEEFHFVSMLQVDDSLQKYLTDILFSFPATSCLHIFITPKLSSTSLAKYTINVSRRVCFFPEEGDLSVILRDRSTDHEEHCSSITKAFSIVSSFEDDLYDNYLARVFELPLFFSKDTFSLVHIEFMIFDKEREVWMNLISNADKDDSSLESSSTSSSSYEIHNFTDGFDENGNSLVTTENSSSSGYEQESNSRATSISPLHAMECMNTSFCLNFDETFVKTLSKLARINKHTLAYIQPKGKEDDSSQSSKQHPPHVATLEKCVNKGMTNGDEDHCTFNDLQNVSSMNKDITLPQSKHTVYMLSIRNWDGLQIFLYGKSPVEMSQWKCIEEIDQTLKDRHSDICETHQVYVSRFDDEENSFEKLLYTFLYDLNSDSICNGDLKCNGCSLQNGSSTIEFPCVEQDAHQSTGNKEMKQKTAQSTEENFDQLQTPSFQASKSFVVPKIIISPPENYEDSIHKTAMDINISQENSSYKPPALTPEKQITSEIENDHKIQTFPDHKSQVKETSLFCKAQTLSGDGNSSTSLLSDSTKVFGNKEETSFNGTSRLSPPSIQKNIPEKNGTMSGIMTHDSVTVSKKGENLDPNFIDIPLETSTESIEGNSNKENATLCCDLEAQEENYILNKSSKQVQSGVVDGFKVRHALVVHLTDRLSSFHEQKGRAAGNLLLYLAIEAVDEVKAKSSTFLGLVLFDDKDILHSRFKVPSSFQPSCLETALNVMLAWYILRVSAEVDDQVASRMHVLVQSPIQRDSASIMLAADCMDCKAVVTNCWEEDLRNDLQSMLPRCQILEGRLDFARVLPLVGRKQGIDVVVMLRQQELGLMLDLMAPSGRLVLCGDVDRTEEIRLSALTPNSSVTMFDPLSALRHLCCLQGDRKERFETELFSSLIKEDSRLDDNFPSAEEGYFYKILGQVSTSGHDQAPGERCVLDVFFSVASTPQQVLLATPRDQRTMVEEVYNLMTIFSTEDLTFFY